MRPRRTHESQTALSLPGANEDHDLWVALKRDENNYPMLCSVWEPSPEERERIANGENIELFVWAVKTPPVAVEVTAVPLGKPPEPPPGDEEWPEAEDPPDPL